MSPVVANGQRMHILCAKERAVDVDEAAEAAVATVLEEIEAAKYTKWRTSSKVIVGNAVSRATRLTRAGLHKVAREVNKKGKVKMVEKAAKARRVATTAARKAVRQVSM